MRERSLQAQADAERAGLLDEHQSLRNGLPEVHGIACDLQGFHQRLRLLGVARASLLDLGMRAAAAESKAADHGRLAEGASQRSEQHRRLAERMAMVSERLAARMRRRAEQSIEDELEEISTWSTL